MPFKFFVVPIRQTDAESELNAFLNSHRVLSIERHWVDQGSNSFWSICVDYLEPKPAGAVGNRGTSSKGKVDYREVLSPEDFAVFAQLREWRKEAATGEGVPVYMIFTNEQLAQIVQQQVSGKSDLAKIDGVGQARVDKYADALLAILTKRPEPSHETSRESV
jgi:superfamily II DNA helicase RecQ